MRFTNIDCIYTVYTVQYVYTGQLNTSTNNNGNNYIGSTLKQTNNNKLIKAAAIPV